jgi:hypothetical protein
MSLTKSALNELTSMKENLFIKFIRQSQKFDQPSTPVEKMGEKVLKCLY